MDPALRYQDDFHTHWLRGSRVRHWAWLRPSWKPWVAHPRRRGQSLGHVQHFATRSGRTGPRRKPRGFRDKSRSPAAKHFQGPLQASRGRQPQSRESPQLPATPRGQHQVGRSQKQGDTRGNSRSTPRGQGTKVGGGGWPDGESGSSGPETGPRNFPSSSLLASGHRPVVGMAPTSPHEHHPDDWPQTQSTKCQLLTPN